MIEFLATLDRRWVFLMMGIAVAVPVLTRATFPEAPTPMTRRLFETVEELPAGSVVYLAYDYDPGSAPELGPMATAFVRHCCLKKHKMIFATLWPTGTPLLDQSIRDVIQAEFPDENFQDGIDYVNLGYRPGNEVAIKGVATDIRKTYSTDINGTSLNVIPLMKPINNVLDCAIILNLSAGTPGAKEWVQYAGTAGTIKIGAGLTGVQAPLLYPYYPDQLIGMLPAIKGAAEYEAALAEKYPQYRDPKLNKAISRMGPQLFAHLLMVGLIVLGNVVHFTRRRQPQGGGP